MANSLFFVLVTSLLLLLPLSLAAAEPRKALADPKTATEAIVEKQIPGGYEPIKNITDPHIQNLGKAVVDAYNQLTHSHLVFLKVYSGKSQVVAGINYDLLLNAMDGTVKRTFGTLIYEDLKGNTKLIKFCIIFVH